MSLAPAAEIQHPRRWLVLFAMTGSLSMIMLDVTVVAVALARLSADLGMSPAGEHWAMNAYTLTIASLVALGGRCADAIGRVRCFLIGIGIFAGASALCGLAQSSEMFIASRALQGLGAALMQPASSTIVVSSFAPGERGKAMGIYVGIPMLFLTLGPVVGGVLTSHVSWRACFLLNLPVAALALVLTALARPDGGPRMPARIRPLEIGSYLLGLPAFVFGIQQGVEWGWSSPAVLLPLVGGLLLVVAFVRVQWRSATPLLSVRLFADRGFLGNACVLFCAQFAMTGQVIHMSTWFQRELGYSPDKAGLALLPMMLPTLFIVHVAGRMYDKVGARRPILIGTTLAALGLAIEAIAVPFGLYAPVAVGLAIFGLGIGFTMSPTNTDALSRVGPERRGQASGLLGTLRQVAGSLGIAVIGAAVLVGGLSAGHWVACASFLLALAAAASFIQPRSATEGAVGRG
jgi:EmrB/QacA subfamily drug resistance transporter